MAWVVADKIWNIFNNKDFTHNCVFKEQLGYKLLKDDLYIVHMESGRDAIYKRIDKGTYYGGTGQKDFLFKFKYYIPS